MESIEGIFEMRGKLVEVEKIDNPALNHVLSCKLKLNHPITNYDDGYHDDSYRDYNDYTEHFDSRTR